jgi:hypothetical protein
MIIKESFQMIETRAAANMALSHDGVLIIEREGSINVMINIAEKNQVHSLRGTAFYALGLVATTRYKLRPTNNILKAFYLKHICFKILFCMSISSELSSVNLFLYY